MQTNNHITLPKSDFLDFIRSKIRISSKNVFLSLKSYNLFSPSPFFPGSNTFSHASTSVISQLPNRQSTGQNLLTNTPTEPYNCFMLFIAKSLRNLLPDIEIIKFKQTCLNIISQLDNPSEGHFGLAKIYCYEGKYTLALQQLKLIINRDPNDASYLIWKIVVKTICIKTKKQALKIRGLCRSKFYLELLLGKIGIVEINWALMRIALSGLLIVGSEIDRPEKFASAILRADKYYGYLAFAQIQHEPKAVKTLKALGNIYPLQPEACIQLWNYLYYSQSAYAKALKVIETAYLNIKDFKDYEVLISLNYAKSLHKTGKIKQSIELLQLEYTKHSVYIVYLYHYARICIKSGDEVFLGSAVGALKECLKICTESRHGHIFYWLSKAYLKLNERILAFKSIKKAIVSFSKEIESKTEYRESELKIQLKTGELKAMLGSCYINTEVFDRIKFILKKFQAHLIEEFTTLVKIVKECDKLYGEILESQALWKFNYKDDALKTLYNNFKTSRVQMKSFFLMAKFLKEEKDYENIKKICETMIKKCRNPSIPVQVWLKVHLTYAKTLINLNNASKAILIYKCLAQVQPAPYIPDLLYTRILQQANTIEDLFNAPQTALKFKDLKWQDLKFSRVQLLSSKRNLSSLVICEGEEEIHNSRLVVNENNQLLGSRTPEPLPKALFSRTPLGDNANPGFSVSIYYLFLYKIGKTCGKYKMNVEDGLLAMHDFLIMHHYWMKEGIENDEKRKVKAIYWMGVLYHHSEQYQQAAQHFKECLCMLFQLGLEEMSEKVQVALKEYREHGITG
jgi:tetratricopeptide (TPR) repeat protein